MLVPGDENPEMGQRGTYVSGASKSKKNRIARAVLDEVVAPSSATIEPRPTVDASLIAGSIARRFISHPDGGLQRRNSLYAATAPSPPRQGGLSNFGPAAGCSGRRH